MPPLRERKDDIPILINYFLATYSLKNGKKQKRIPDSILEPMINYHWQGNIRELKNFIERLVIMSDSDEISSQEVVSFFPETFKGKYEFLEREDKTITDGVSLKEQLEQFEKQLLRQVQEGRGEWFEI